MKYDSHKMPDDQFQTIDLDGSDDEPRLEDSISRRLVQVLSLLVVVVSLSLVIGFSLWGGTTSGTSQTTPPTLETTAAPDATLETTAAPDAAALPHCESMTQLVVEGFFDAMANGDATEAERHIATDGFVFYTELPYRTGIESRNRETLLHYLQQRTAEGYRLNLVNLRFHGGTGDRIGNFGIEAHNEDGKTISGTGAVDCDAKRIVRLGLTAPTKDARLNGYVNGQCIPTIPTEEFVPPEPYLPSRAEDGMAWYGTNELWTVLMLDGDHSPRKSVWWSENYADPGLEPSPDITVVWQRLDIDADDISNGSTGTNGSTADDGLFIIGGIDPDIAGCWRVTATYKGASMSYVYERT